LGTTTSIAGGGSSQDTGRHGHPPKFPREPIAEVLAEGRALRLHDHGSSKRRLERAARRGGDAARGVGGALRRGAADEDTTR